VTSTKHGREGREATKRKLIRAVRDLLAAHGFQGLGLNRTARQAGVDKVLIYRYFGGLPGLVREFARSEDFWPGPADLIGPDQDRIRRMSNGEKLALFFRRFIRELRRRPLTLDILAWETGGPHELARELDKARERGALEFFERVGFEPPEDQDLAAVMAVLSGAVRHLLIRSRRGGTWGGLDLGSDLDWERIERAVEKLVLGMVAD